MFDGAFAAVAFKEGELHYLCLVYVNTMFCVAQPTCSFANTTGDLIEKGVMRRLPDGFDGNTCPYIFTWSTERPNKVRNDGAFPMTQRSTLSLLTLVLPAIDLGNGIRMCSILQHLQGRNRQHPHGSLFRRGPI